MAIFEIITSPIGSQLTSTIASDEDADKNDFSVYLYWGENVSGLTEADITLSAVDSSDDDISDDVSLVSLEGENSVYRAVVRPMEESGLLTLTIAEDAVTEGNDETTQDIRVSTTFPDADAEVPTQLFTHGFTSTQVVGITVTPLRIIIGREPFNTRITLYKYLHDGTAQTGETVSYTSSGSLSTNAIDAINGDILANNLRLREVSGSLERVDAYALGGKAGGIAHTRLGFIRNSGTRQLSTLQYGQTPIVTHDYGSPESYSRIAHQGNLLYLNDSHEFGLAEITDSDEIQFRSRLNIEDASNGYWFDSAIYQDTLYMVSGDRVSTLDIKKYRPMSKNTKKDIHPVIIHANATIDLTDYAPDAETIIFDEGFDKPSWLSISSNSLSVDTASITETTTCFVRLKGINRIDATETGMFGFYLIVMPLTAPSWKPVTELTLRANSTYNLRQLVTADSISFRAGKSQPTGASLSDGIFTIGTASGTAEFTATENSLESHISLDIDVIQTQSISRGTRLRYKVEIEGIDVSADLLNAPRVSENLDPIAVNETRINEATVVLRGKDTYDSNKAGNFWSENNLNAGGFQNAIKVYTEHFINNAWTENLLFSGIILESVYPIGQAEFRLNCVDASHILQNLSPTPFGNLTKWAETRKATEEETYQGIYTPESGLLPIQLT